MWGETCVPYADKLKSSFRSHLRMTSFCVLIFDFNTKYIVVLLSDPMTNKKFCFTTKIQWFCEPFWL